MAENNEHLDKDPDLKVSDKLAADLKAIFTPDMAIPPEADRAIIDKAHRRLPRPRPLRFLRWAAPIAAAAAIVIVATLNFTKESRPDFARQPAKLMPYNSAERDADRYKAAPARDEEKYAAYSMMAEPVSADIDLNGRVDILDAFKLAKHIESADQPNKNWDINGDGLLNRGDVDFIAFAAVRLDKGAL